MFSMGISARIVKRIITLLIVTLGVVTLSFCLQIFTGTDPAEMLVRKTTLFATEEQIQAMRVELGLDGTLSEQYADYIKGLLTGDLGISITNRKPVVKAKLFCPEIAGLFCRIAGLFCHDSRANLSLKPVCFGIAIS